MKQRRRAHHGLRALCAALLATVGIAARSAPVAVEHAPPAWIAYAQQLTSCLESALRSKSVQARRFHAFFTETSAQQPDAAHPATLQIQVWVDADGRVANVAFQRLENAQADADLRTLLLQRRVGAPPPRGMRQPVTVRLRLAQQEQEQVSAVEEKASALLFQWGRGDDHPRL